jgi:Holliday junction DNA helicase RuvA
MIAYLKGTPTILEQRLILTVNNVGYEVYVGQRILATAAQKDELELFVYTHVREDRIELYGFNQPEQLKLFKMMTDVSGIGPKTGLDIVDHNPKHIIDAVQNARISFFTPIPRIGKKTAQKIILELKSKLGSLKELNLGPKSQKEQDVIEALTGLGFDQDQIHQAMESVDVEELKLDQAIKKTMKKIG